jgi:cytochrome c2
MRVIFGSLIFLAMIGTAFADGDPEHGAKVFRKCQACHAVGPEAKPRVGPPLNGIIGTQAGTQEIFAGKYSKAMIEAGENGLVWDEETLMVYLKKPKDLVDGTKMAFAGLTKEDEKADVIAYLKQFDAEGNKAE